MGGWIEWWCHLIGIDSAGSIQIATGIVGGGTVLMAVYFVLMMVLAIFGAILDSATSR